VSWFSLSGGQAAESPRSQNLSQGYISEAGEIRLDGKSINEQNQESYRQLFATVFSDFLFERLLASGAIT